MGADGECLGVEGAVAERLEDRGGVVDAGLEEAAVDHVACEDVAKAGGDDGADDEIEEGVDCGLAAGAEIAEGDED